MEVFLMIVISSVTSTIVCKLYQNKLMEITLDSNEKFLIELEKITLDIIKEFINK